MNKKICNPKTDVCKGIKLNEKDLMMELLIYLKDLEKNYTVALTEASNEYLFNKYYESFDNICKLQRKVFELMFKNGWYVLSKAEEVNLNKQYNLLKNELENL